MKFLIIFFLVVSENFVYSEKPKIDGDISQIISSDAWKDSTFRTNITPDFRFRAIKYDPIKSESGGRLIVEKLHRGSVGLTYKVHFSKKVELLANKLMKDEFKKLHFESQIGCCHANELMWYGFELSYNVKLKNESQCIISNVNKEQSKLQKS